MAIETAPPPEGQSVTALISGIVADAQELVKQQVAMVRAELKADYRRTVRAAGLLLIGGILAVPGVSLLCTMFADLLHETAGLSMWASDGIVGGVFLLLSAVLLGIGFRWFRSFNPLPDQSVEAFKENVRWTTSPK